MDLIDGGDDLITGFVWNIMIWLTVRMRAIREWKLVETPMMNRCAAMLDGVEAWRDWRELSDDNDDEVMMYAYCVWREAATGDGRLFTEPLGGDGDLVFRADKDILILCRWSTAA